MRHVVVLDLKMWQRVLNAWLADAVDAAAAASVEPPSPSPSPFNATDYRAGVVMLEALHKSIDTPSAQRAMALLVCLAGVAVLYALSVLLSRCIARLVSIAVFCVMLATLALAGPPEVRNAGADVLGASYRLCNASYVAAQQALFPAAA